MPRPRLLSWTKRSKNAPETTPFDDVDQLLEEVPSSPSMPKVVLDEPLVPWFFDTIPYSFKQWVKSNLTERADEKWGLNDEYTVESTFDNLEFYIRNKKMTKSEKRVKMIGLVRAVGVEGSTQFVDDMMDQLEKAVIKDEDDETQKRQQQRDKQYNLSQGAHSPSLGRSRSRSVH
eukprot:TRINITY_DN15625_c0_g1_i1.p1 TRINITY_DN15625_c0_g1~~TRINITY_DN15625_c0_g1_i1.p1  ORF type:complete len:175 (-),score=27.67 TRINITY_DN15625_c0_g1_i1:92-616(-)